MGDNAETVLRELAQRLAAMEESSRRRDEILTTQQAQILAMGQRIDDILHVTGCTDPANREADDGLRVFWREMMAERRRIAEGRARRQDMAVRIGLVSAYLSIPALIVAFFVGFRDGITNLAAFFGGGR